MNKKILMINGSARKKNTYKVLLKVEQILKSHNFEVEIINLFDFEIKNCVGCEICVNFEKCPINDAMPMLMEKMLESDGIVLSSPIYMGSVTSKLKSLMDRTNGWIHKNELAGKPMMFVTTTNFSGIKDTGKLLNVYANGLGVRKGEYISRKSDKIDTPIQEKELARFIKLVNQESNLYRPDMGEIVMFNVSKVLAMKSINNDHKYWNDKELFNKYYYFPCKINIGKKIISKFMFKVMSKVIK